MLAKIGSSWYVSSGAQLGWSLHQQTPLVADLKTTVAADFNGDGKTDLAWRSGSTWRYASRGRGTVYTLRLIEPMAQCDAERWGQPQTVDPSLCPQYPELTTALIGNFDGSGGVDVINVERKLTWSSVQNKYTEMPGVYLAFWSQGWTNKFNRRTPQDMR